MENILNNVPAWATWVFSGIGCLVVTWLASLFVKKNQGNKTKITKKSTIKGDNNTAIQEANNSTINIGK